MSALIPTLPTQKSPWLLWLGPLGVMSLVFPLGALLGTTHFRSAPVAALNLGLALAALGIFTLVKEVNHFVGRSALVWWHCLLPLYNLYWAVAVVRTEVGRAKERAGKGVPRGVVAYALALPYALASDGNDLVGAPALSGAPAS